MTSGVRASEDWHIHAMDHGTLEVLVEHVSAAPLFILSTGDGSMGGRRNRYPFPRVCFQLRRFLMGYTHGQHALQRQPLGDKGEAQTSHSIYTMKLNFGSENCFMEAFGPWDMEIC